MRREAVYWCAFLVWLGCVILTAWLVGNEAPPPVPDPVPIVSFDGEGATGFYFGADEIIRCVIAGAEVECPCDPKTMRLRKDVLGISISCDEPTVMVFK